MGAPPAPVWLRHDASLRHAIPGHPERPQRLLALEAAMSERGWLGCELRTAPQATREQLERVHPAAHLDAIEALCAGGGGQIDMDTACIPETWPAVLHAAGGACAMVDALLGEGVRAGVAALRPPGHHAETARAMGFCFVNNVAVAAAHARAAHGAQRVLILDWDVHHGNGTNDIFHADPGVLFVSIHQSPLYPGTGSSSDVGSGPGEGHTVNLPVPGGSGDETFCSLVEHVVVPLARAYEPALLLVSAGYDAHREDPLAGCSLTDDGYAAMTASMRRLAGELGIPLGIVLEGGYALGALSRSVVATLEVAGNGAVAPPDVALHPLAETALERLGRYWPALGV